jgi:malate synthase
MSILKDLVTISGIQKANYDTILTPEALQFIYDLHTTFNPRREQLLQVRRTRTQELSKGRAFDYPTETASIRADQSWKGASIPNDLKRRWVEITGPTDAKMMINAFNSKANVYMADFEDANSPTWDNLIQGQLNLIEAIEGTLHYTSPEGKSYKIESERATLMVRPRGWHLHEKHVIIKGEPISASLFDFGLFFFHNARRLIQKGSGPYFYLPKLESYIEARLWNDVFIHAQKALHIPVGTIRATVLVETIGAAFQMEEILYELREHSAGLNAGRWDYLFSIIKKFAFDRHFIFPDRSELTMTNSFMRAYCLDLVKTCHRRSVQAIGGMSAFIPSRRDAAVNEKAMKQVRADKEREVTDGFDGTWVAHPDLVPLAKEIMSEGMKGKDNQLNVLREDFTPKASALINFSIPNAKVTLNGVINNISIALAYIESWLRGVGAAAINNLMEDAATAEISRAQLWQWLHHPGVILDNGAHITKELYTTIIDNQVKFLSEGRKDKHRYAEAKKILEKLVFSEDFIDFLTLDAYNHLEE